MSTDLRSILPLLGYLALTFILTYPLIRQFGSAIPGDSFDGWQNVWNMWWIKVALLQRHLSPYFTDLIYAPTGVSLLFQTLNPFNGLVTLPVQLAWGLIPAYNTAVVLSFAAGGLGAYLLARYVLGPGQRSRWPAFAAGLIFTFAPYHIAHLLGHLQLIALEWIPFYALYLLRVIRRPRRKDVLLAVLFLVLVALCDWYYVMYCLIFAGLALIWATWRALVAARNSDFMLAGGFLRAAARRLARCLAAPAVSLALFGLVMSPLLGPMVAEARRSNYMVPDPEQSRTLSADLLAFVTPQEFHPVWGAWAREQAKVFTSTVSEHQVFAGYSVLLLAALGVWAGVGRFGKSPRRRGGDLPNRPTDYRVAPGKEGGGDLANRPTQGGAATARRGAILANHPTPSARFWLLMVLVFAVLALGPVLHVGGRTALLPGGAELPLPFGWLARAVPFLQISRSVSRFDVMVMLGVGVLAALGLKWISAAGANRPQGRTWPAVLFAGPILGLILAEFWPAPYPMSPPDTPAWYHSLAADDRPGAVLNLPMNWDRPGYLLYQTVHGKPLAAAYISRNDPRTLVDRAPVLQGFRHLGPDILDFDPTTQGQGELADLGIRWVVLDRYKMPGQRERSYNEDTAKLIFAGREPAYQDERLTVYEVSAQGSRTPYAVLGDGWETLHVDAVTGARSRVFTGQASVIVQAPAAGRVVLQVTLASGSAALAAEGGGGQYRVPLEVQPGANPLALLAAAAGGRVEVNRIAVISGQP